MKNGNALCSLSSESKTRKSTQNKRCERSQTGRRVWTPRPDATSHEGHFETPVEDNV